MSNERLRAAMHQAGLEVDQLADAVEVDTKTVRRWIAGRRPRGRYRTRVAQALNTSEQEIWPELDLQLAGRDEKGEILAAYAHTNDLATPDWRTLLHNARHRIDLLDSTLAEILPAAGTPELLAEKAAAGCQIRLLLSAPDSAHLTLTDQEQDDSIDLLDITDSARDAERSLTIAEHLSDTHGLQARTFVASRFNTILRFDDEMLVTLHLYATPGEEGPLLHLRRHSDHGLFTQFATHLDTLWQTAQPVAPPPPPAS